MNRHKDYLPERFSDYANWYRVFYAILSTDDFYKELGVPAERIPVLQKFAEGTDRLNRLAEMLDQYKQDMTKCRREYRKEPYATQIPAPNFPGLPVADTAKLAAGSEPYARETVRIIIAHGCDMATREKLGIVGAEITPVTATAQPTVKFIRQNGNHVEGHVELHGHLGGYNAYADRGTGTMVWFGHFNHAHFMDGHALPAEKQDWHYEFIFTDDDEIGIASLRYPVTVKRLIE
ncbi:MAG: hypothetical protein LBK60_02905 [Verrucomicrobiales bacterium]|jgi:hypothetical protein|nr:hypothetical protein [Verrucomicrobiales bacterium]